MTWHPVDISQPDPGTNQDVMPVEMGVITLVIAGEGIRARLDSSMLEHPETQTIRPQTRTG